MSEIDDLSFKLGELTNAVKEAHKKIDKVERQNGQILKAVNSIKTNCPVQQQRITQAEEDIDELKKHGVPKRTKTQINLNTAITVLNGLVTIVKTWVGL